KDPHLQLPPGPRDRPSRGPDQGQSAGDPGRRARRLQRGARGRREAAQAGGVMPSQAAPVSSVRDALSAAEDALRASGSDSPRLDAELLLAHAMGVQRETLVTESDAGVPAAAARGAMELIRGRVAREPVAYILGSKGFRYIDLRVDSRVLIPRPETELLVELALGLPERAHVHDVGTGS